jgi:hypothetical protein
MKRGVVYYQGTLLLNESQPAHRAEDWQLTSVSVRSRLCGNPASPSSSMPATCRRSIVS